MLNLMKIMAAITLAFSTLAGMLGIEGKYGTPEFVPDTPRTKEEYSMGEFDFKSSDIIVSPKGNDKWSGKLAEPNAVMTDGSMKTLPRVKEKLKALINADVGHVTVWLREGTYSFDSTLAFTGEDLGDVTYRAYPGEKVIFTGSKPISGWTSTTVNDVNAFIAPSNGAEFNLLSDGTTSLPRTRYPETGYLFVEEKIPGEEALPDAYELFRGSTSFIAAEGSVADFRNLTDVAVRVLHRWKDEFVTIKSYDTVSRRVALSRPTAMTIENGDKYFLENVFEQLNTPGEWYLDRAEKRVYYVPREGESAESLVLYAGTLEQLITVSGVSNITFKDIVFADNGFSIPKNNAEIDTSSQAGYDANPCFFAENCENINIIGCTFRNIGGGCVKFGVNVENSSVKTCFFKNIGAQAVYIHGENVPLDSERITKNILITDNHITQYGRTFFNSCAILIIHANSVEVSQNEIHDGYYTGISVGWVWGYSYTVTDNNKITNNLIYDIGQGWLSDMGGIYTLGTQPNTVLSGNVIYNVAADSLQGGYGGWGIYLDEGSSEILVEKNLAYDCGSQSFHQHYGRDNMIRNNIFALSREGQIRISRKEDHNSLFLENNIIVSDGTPVYCSVEKEKGTDNGNIIWDYTYGMWAVSCKSEKLKSKNACGRLTMRTLGFYNNTLFADPWFKDAKNFDFSLAENSPAFTNGFEAWDFSAAGTLTKF